MTFRKSKIFLLLFSTFSLFSCTEKEDEKENTCYLYSIPLVSFFRSYSKWSKKDYDVLLDPTNYLKSFSSHSYVEEDSRYSETVVDEITIDRMIEMDVESDREDAVTSFCGDNNLHVVFFDYHYNQKKIQLDPTTNKLVYHLEEEKRNRQMVIEGKSGIINASNSYSYATSIPFINEDAPFYQSKFSMTDLNKNDIQLQDKIINYEEMDSNLSIVNSDPKNYFLYNVPTSSQRMPDLLFCNQNDDLSVDYHLYEIKENTYHQYEVGDTYRILDLAYPEGYFSNQSSI